MKILFRIEGIPDLYKLMKKQKKLDFIFQGNTLQKKSIEIKIRQTWIKSL